MSSAVAERPTPVKAPFPYFGGKSRVAALVWERLGDVPNYVEPFFGSGAVLLSRPHWPKVETVNDIDALLCNFWRAVQADPEQTAAYADWPVSEPDLIARHLWLVNRKAEFTDRLQADPEFYDCKAAGWWCWGICCWIGSGWCSGDGPWQTDGSKLVHLGDAGQGVNRQLVHLGDAGQGVNRQLVHLGNAGQNKILREPDGILDWFTRLAERLARVRVCCGDWERVCGPTPTTKQGLTGVFLDPPYADTAERAEVYSHDDDQVAHAVREWAIANGDNPLLRIALCGYEGEHVIPDTWDCVAWKSAGGYAGQCKGGKRNDNGTRERIWFSPHCLQPAQQGLFTGRAA